MFNPKVSIIIPVYNGSNYLSEAIESALAQTYNNTEILVINDGSNDNGATEKIALSFGDKIKYIYKENGGVATALNLGIEKASGEYISWLSHDDLYYPNKIEVQIKTLNELNDKTTVIYSNFEYIDNNGFFLKKSGLNLERGKEYYNLIINSGSIHGCSTLINKKCFENIGLFNTDKKTVQDIDMWFRLIDKYHFFYINSILLKSRLHENQDSKTKTFLMQKEYIELMDIIIKNNSLIKIYNISGLTIIGFIKSFILNYYIKNYLITKFGYRLKKYKFGKYLSKIWIKIISK